MSTTGQNGDGVTGMKSSLRNKYVYLTFLIALTVLVGGGYLYKQLSDFQGIVDDSRELNRKMHFFHQLDHAAVMVTSTMVDFEGLDHIAHEMERDQDLIGGASDAEKALIDPVLKGLQDPIGFREIILGNMEQVDDLHKSYDEAVRQGRREFSARIDYAQKSLLVAAFLFVLVVTVPPLFLVASMTSGLTRLREKILIAEQGGNPKTVAIKREDEIGQVADAVDVMHATLEARNEERRINRYLLAEQEKLSGIVNFIGGLAHEVGNPLASVIAHLEMIETRRGSVCDHRCPAEDEIVSYFQSIKESAFRIERLLRQITTLESHQRIDGTPMDLNELVKNIHSMVSLDDRMRNVSYRLNLCDRVPAIQPPLPIPRLASTVYTLLNQIAREASGTTCDVWVTTTLVPTKDNVSLKVMCNCPVAEPEPVDSDPADPELAPEQDQLFHELNFEAAHRVLETCGGDLQRIHEESGWRGWEMQLPTDGGKTSAVDAVAAAPAGSAS